MSAINNITEIKLVSMSRVAEKAMQNIVNNLNHKFLDNLLSILGLFDKLSPPNNP